MIQQARTNQRCCTSHVSRLQSTD